MALQVLPAPFDLSSPVSQVLDFMRWLDTHRSALMVAGLLGLAYPLTTMVGALGVAPDLSLELALSGGARAAALWSANTSMLILAGYLFVRLSLPGWRAPIAAFALGSGVASLPTSIAYFNAWSDMLAATAPGRGFAMDTFAMTLSMSLIYFSHLRHSRAHEVASLRVAAARQAQSEARRRLAQAALQAVQARIDPQLLFDMLEAVRLAYETDAQRAEQLLDELVAFLRAALPRLQHASSSVPREAELTRAMARLHVLARVSEVAVSLDVAADVMDARFPPGVLLPLFNDALRLVRAGHCSLAAIRQADDCQVALTLPARPSEATLERVHALLHDLYGPAAALRLEPRGSAAHVTLKVPYEPA